MKTLHIFYRSCAIVKTLSKTSERPFGLDKETMILKCLKSLLESCMQYASPEKIKIDLLDDSSPTSFREKLKNLLAQYKIKNKVHELSFKNNGKSLRYCYNETKKSKADIIYFCEDDYLHLPNAIPFIMNAYEGKIIGSSNFCVHPTDYPDRYIKIYPAYIFLSKDCHWRSISHTTGTLFITSALFKKYITNFYKLADLNEGGSGGGEEETVNKIYQTTPCLSPIPSLAAHMNDDTLPPFVDWKKEVDRIKI